MGTRYLTAVTFGDKIQIARVGLFDGSPTQAGKDILKVLSEPNGLTLNDWLYRCTEISDEEYDKFFNNGVLNRTALSEAYPDFFYGSAAELFRTLILTDRDPVVHNDYNFMYDSLQCEWAYVIDFKEWTFEVYKGFNKTPLTPKDRFYNNGYHKGEYYPVRLVKKYDLNNLPKEREFRIDIEKSVHRMGLRENREQLLKYDPKFAQKVLSSFDNNDDEMSRIKNAGIYCLCRIKPASDKNEFRHHAEVDALRMFGNEKVNCTVYIDEVLLGERCDRKELDRMISDAIAGKIDFIFFTEIGDLWHSPQKVMDTILRLQQLDKPVKIRCYSSWGIHTWELKTNSFLMDENIIRQSLKVKHRDDDFQFIADNKEDISAYMIGSILGKHISNSMFGDVVMHYSLDLSDEEYNAFISSFGDDIKNIDDVIDCWHLNSDRFYIAVEIMKDKLISYYSV